MNRWQEQLGNHPIHTTLNEARALAKTEHEDPSPELKIEHRRFLKLLDFVETVLAQVDPEIVPFSLLDNLNSGIRHQNIWNQLTAYANKGDHGYLTSANDNLSVQLPTVIQLAVFSKEPLLTKQLKTLEQSVDTFTDAVGGKQELLSEKINESEAERATLEGRLEQLSSKVGSVSIEFEKLTATWQKDFAVAQNERTTQYETWHKATSEQIEGSVEDLIQSGENKLSATNQSFIEKIGTLITEAKERHKDILDLHEIVAGDSVAAGYLQNAQDERKQANYWRWASIIFIVSTAVWTSFSYFNAPGIGMENSDYWGQALKAFSVAGVLLFGAVYSSKQSSLHRTNEQRTKWLALEVKAIDPFIASLAPDEQKELKRKLSEKLFGQSNGFEPETEGAINEHILTVVAKAMSDILKAGKT